MMKLLKQFHAQWGACIDKTLVTVSIFLARPQIQVCQPEWTAWVHQQRFQDAQPHTPTRSCAVVGDAPFVDAGSECGAMRRTKHPIVYRNGPYRNRVIKARYPKGPCETHGWKIAKRQGLPKAFRQIARIATSDGLRASCDPAQNASRRTPQDQR